MNDGISAGSRAAAVSVLLMLLLLLQAVGVLEVLGAVESGRLLEVVVEDLDVVLLHHLPDRDVKHKEGAALTARGLLHSTVGGVEHPHLQNEWQDSDLVNWQKCSVSVSSFRQIQTVRQTVTMVASLTQGFMSIGHSEILRKTQTDIIKVLEVTLLKLFAHKLKTTYTHLCRIHSLL